MSDNRSRVLVALAGLEQAELARRIGVSDSTLSRALRGERRLSRQRRVLLLALLVDALMARQESTE